MSAAIQKTFKHRLFYAFCQKLVFVLFSQIQKKVEFYKHKTDQKGTKVETFDKNVSTTMDISGWSEPEFAIQTLLMVLPTSHYATRVFFDPINRFVLTKCFEVLKFFFLLFSTCKPVEAFWKENLYPPVQSACTASYI